MCVLDTSHCLEFQYSFHIIVRLSIEIVAVSEESRERKRVLKVGFTERLIS